MAFPQRVVSALATAILVIVTGCSGDASDPAFADIRVETMIDETYNIDGFETYAWVAAGAAVRDPDHEWTPSGLDIGSEIMFLVDRELTVSHYDVYGSHLS